MVKTYTSKEIRKFTIFCKKYVNGDLVPSLIQKEVSVHDLQFLDFNIKDEILQANYQCNLYDINNDCFIDSFEFAITLDYQVKIK